MFSTQLNGTHAFRQLTIGSKWLRYTHCVNQQEGDGLGKNGIDIVNLPGTGSITGTVI